MANGPGTIVVIEDDHNISDLLDLYLRREGFRVVQAADGTTGLAAVDRERPRLVILDVGLPGGIDGIEVCRRLRGSSRLPRRPKATLSHTESQGKLASSWNTTPMPSGTSP